MTVFSDILLKYNPSLIANRIKMVTSEEVEFVLQKEVRRPDDFLVLISPVAAPFIEQMAKISQNLTRKRFGKTIQLYIPLYLSNYCDNHCVYCGFNHNNKFERIVLNDEQILREVEVINSYGFEHILLVTGESAKANASYLKHVIKLIHNRFSHISIEVQPLLEDEYRDLINVGLNSVYLYQETYFRNLYSDFHPKGMKADFDFRLDSYDRLGRAGIHKMGLGVLLGLADWRIDSFYLALHLRYLQRKYWKTKFSISFPRLRPNAGSFITPNPVSEKELFQLMCAYRLFDADVEISLSTRENANFRDHAMSLGVTSMSAGSRTDPGGYANDGDELKQFEPNDDRSPSEILKLIRRKGYEAVWKDWDVFMQA